MTGSGDDGLAVGQHRRAARLGSEAVYRICKLDARYARVEVVDAPGLRPGQHFRFTRAEVEAMKLVRRPQPGPASPAVTAGAPTR